MKCKRRWNLKFRWQGSEKEPKTTGCDEGSSESDDGMLVDSNLDGRFVVVFVGVHHWDFRFRT